MRDNRFFKICFARNLVSGIIRTCFQYWTLLHFGLTAIFPFFFFFFFFF
jgi:hypothetical protein